VSAQAARETKSVLLRLDTALAARVQAIAAVEGRAVSDVMREALTALVEDRRKDPSFQRLLDQNRREHEELLRLLSGDDS
jgi:hypothetical protein